MKITKTAVAPFLPDSKGKLIKQADQSSFRGAIHKSAKQVANFSLSEDAHCQIKFLTALLSHSSPLKSSALRIRLIIALEEFNDVISVYPPSQTQEREVWDKALREMNAQWLLKTTQHKLTWF